MKKVIGILMCLVLIASFAAACGGSDADSGADSGLIKVGIVNLPPSESGYRAANVADMERVFNTANGYEVSTSFSLQNDQQIIDARGFIADGVDYLLLSAAEMVGWDAVLREAQEAGIKVFLFDRLVDAPTELFEAAVISDMHNQGKMATEWILRQNFDGGPKVVHIQGQMGSAAQIGRTEPFMEAVNDGRITLVYQQTATWSEDTAKEIVETVIARGDSFNVVYAENDGMAQGAMVALQNAGISHGVGGDVYIIGVDANKWALRHVLNGDWNLNVQCSPFQADVIHGFIQTLEAGGTLDIPANRIVINEERFFEAGAITEADIQRYGLGEDSSDDADVITPLDPSGGLVKVGIVNLPPSESGYRAANVADMERVFNEANGYEVSTAFSLQNDQQIIDARGFIADGVDYLLLSAAEMVGWDAVLREAQEAGIKVFLFDRLVDAPSSLFEAAVVSDMHNQGIMARDWILRQDFGADGPKVVHIQGQMGSAAQIGRTEPFMEAVDDGRITLVFQQTATWSEDTAKDIVESVIASQGAGSFNVVYAENDGMAQGAMIALQNAGISHGLGGDVYIIGVDANKWALRHVLNGDWNLNVQCSPFQASVIHGFISTLEAGGTLNVPPDKIVINEERYFEAGVITEADIQQYGLGDE